MIKRADDICKMTILYVDDDPEISQVMCDRLSKNYPTQVIMHAENALDALAKMREFDPDIFICDLSMPFIEGLLLAQQILSKGNEHPLVFLSVFNDKILQLGSGIGSVHCLAKPVNFESLFYKLDTLMVEAFLKRFTRAKQTSGIMCIMT